MKKYELFVGIDISKNWIDVALSLDGKLKGMSHKRFDNNLKGFKQLLAWLKKTKVQHWLVCMEHTGIYTLPLCTFLTQHSIDFVLESALRIKKSIGIKRGKDDKADAKDIARFAYLYREELKISRLDPKVINELKSLLAYRERLIKSKVQLEVSSKELKLFGNPHSANKFVVQNSLDLLNVIKLQIKEVEQALKNIIYADLALKEIYVLLISIKGIGLVTAISLIVYTKGFIAFKSWRQFAAYIGTAPFKQESGTSLKRPAKVSKLGHKKVKVLLSNCITSAIQYDQEIAAYYKRKIAEGKNKFKVFNAIKNKLLSRAFAVVKRGTPYVQLNKHYA